MKILHLYTLILIILIEVTRITTCNACIIPNCQKCSDIRTCLICNPHYGLANNAHSCFKCIDKNCVTCSPTAANCTLCPKSYYLTPHRTCLQCPAGTWSDGTSNNCVACTPNCQVCNSSSTCMTCSKGFSAGVNGSCSGCPAGQFFNGYNCNVCVMNCLICNSSSSCQTCAGNFVVNNYGICTTTSPLICPANCSNCSSLSCLICSPGFGLYDTGCKLCASDQFSTGSLPCINCTAYCVTCASVNTCKTCKPGFSLVNGLCYCPLERFITDSGCVTCASNCENCTSPTVCTKCAQNYGLYNGTCKACPTGKYSSGNTTCIDCIANCSNCKNNQTCDICSPGKTYNAGVCSAVVSQSSSNQGLILGLSIAVGLLLILLIIVCVLKRNAKFQPNQVEREPRDTQKGVKVSGGAATASIINIEDNLQRI